MSTSTATTLITDSVANFGTAALAVLTATIAISVGLLVFYWGWRKIRGTAR